ncbi:MAG: hypothetical protein ABSB95_07175 [Dissulfurispiraceae bacterium]|jgi:sorbitol-specific phosphotransferase system component IIBC
MATKVIINPGACGFPATVVVKKKDGKTLFSVSVTSECEMVSKLGYEIAELTMIDAFKRLMDNPVYRKGAICLRHVACPVLSGILKALEVEAGLNLPKDASITFVTDEK